MSVCSPGEEPMGTHENRTSELAFGEEKVSDQAQRQGCSAVVLQSFPARTLNHRGSAKAPERTDTPAKGLKCHDKSSMMELTKPLDMVPPLVNSRPSLGDNVDRTHNHLCHILGISQATCSPFFTPGCPLTSPAEEGRYHEWLVWKEWAGYGWAISLNSYPSLMGSSSRWLQGIQGP